MVTARAFSLSLMRLPPATVRCATFSSACSVIASPAAEAGKHLGIVSKKLDGVSYVMRPHNLVAAKTASGPRFMGTASEGNAA